jgi:cleavage and polyadenylation specificity factor subunit 1
LRGEFVRGLSIFDLARPSLDKGFIYVDSKVFPTSPPSCGTC